MKKTFHLLLGAALVCSVISMQAFAATSLTEQQAKTVAEKVVPSGSTHLRTENDDSNYEVKFYNEANQEWYKVEVSKATQKVVAFDSDALKEQGSKTVKLTETQAKKVVTDEWKDAEILGVSLEKDDGYQEYEVRFKTAAYYGEYTIHPETGLILSRDIYVGQARKEADIKGLISYDKAIELAKAKLTGGVVTDVDLDEDDGVYHYEVEMLKDGVEYEYIFDAKTGNLLREKSEKGKYANSTTSSTAATTSSDIGLEKAKQIALAKAPAGATVKKIELDHDDGRAVYEGELKGNGVEYEFEIDAATGAILSWDTDYDD